MKQIKQKKKKKIFFIAIKIKHKKLFQIKIFEICISKILNYI